MDELPVVTGLNIAAALRKERPTTAIVFLSTYLDNDRLFPAIQVGAAVFLSKDTDPRASIDTIHAVQRGENLLHQTVLINTEPARRFLEILSLSEGSNGADIAASLFRQRK